MKEKLWAPPRLRTTRRAGRERHASWLELFFDLVFVVAVTQLGRHLSADLTLSGAVSFAALFVPVWWAWIGETFYADRFGADDIDDRLLTLAQMLAMASLAVNVRNGLDATAAGFALSYAATRAVLVVQYLRAYRSVPAARALTSRYTIGFSLAALIWLLSVLVPLPLRYVVWGIALFVDFITPVVTGRQTAKLAPHEEHLPDRVGLFTIIVLGEAVGEVVGTLSEQQWGLLSAMSGGAALILAFALWWIYFDSLDSATIEAAREGDRVGTGFYQAWVYAHLPLVIGLTATAVGAEKIIASNQHLAAPEAVRWLICGGVALYLGALGLIHATRWGAKAKAAPAWQAIYRIGTAIIILGIAWLGGRLLPVTVVLLLVLLGAGQVVLDLSQPEIREDILKAEKKSKRTEGP